MHGESHVFGSNLMYAWCHNALAKRFDLTIRSAFVYEITRSNEVPASTCLSNECLDLAAPT